VSHDTKRLLSSFLASLRENWKTTLPQAIPAKRSGLANMPRSGTFYLEMDVVAESVAPHVFVVFQASVRPWSAGHFTANVIVACSRDEPSPVARNPTKLENFDRGREGRHRLGKLVHGADKCGFSRRIESPHRPHYRGCGAPPCTSRRRGSNGFRRRMPSRCSSSPKRSTTPRWTCGGCCCARPRACPRLAESYIVPNSTARIIRRQKR
jgi:hypothetical protein